MRAEQKWPKIKWAEGYFYFDHMGKRYTQLTQGQIGALLRATMVPMSIHVREVKGG